MYNLSYEAMAVEELKKINVKAIGDCPSFLFLWAGTDHLEDAR